MFKKLLIGIIALIVVGYLALWIGVKIFLPAEKVMAIISEQGSAALGREVKVGGASVGVFPAIKLNVENVSLANGKKFSEEPMFSIKAISLQIDFMSIVSMSPVIKEIRLVEPDILLEVDKNGVMNLDGLGGTQAKEEEEEVVQDSTPTEIPTSLPGNLAMKAFIIENARVRYKNHQTGQYITLGDINQNVSVDIDSKLENIKTVGELIVASIAVEDKASGVQKGKVRFSLNHNVSVNLPKQEIVISEVKVGLQDIFISTKGQVQNFLSGPPNVDVTVKSNEIKMASILKEVPSNLSPDIPKLSASGHALIDAAFAAVLDSAPKPKMNINLSLHDMNFSHKDIPASLNDLNGTLKLTENDFSLTNFSFFLDKHPVNIAIAISNLLKTPNLDKFDLRADFDLGKFMELADKFGVAPVGTELAGFIKANIQANGVLDPNNPMGINASGNVSLKDIKVVSPELPEKLEVNGQVEINNASISEKLAVKLGESDLNVNVDVKDYLAMAMTEMAKGKKTNVVVNITSAYLDLDKLLPTGSTEEEVTEEVESEPLTEYPELPDVLLSLNMNLKKTKLMDLEMTNYSQKTVLNNSILKSNLKGYLYTGSFSNDLTVNLQDRKSAQIDMKLNVNKVEANDFISVINDKIPPSNAIAKSFSETDNTVFGKLQLDMDVKTFGLPQDFSNNMTGDIYAGVLNGELKNVGVISSLSSNLTKLHKSLSFKGFTFSKLDMDLEARDGKMIVKHLDIEKSPVGKMDFGGSVGFDNSLDLTVTQTLTGSQSKMLAGAQSKGKDALAKAAGTSAFNNISAFPQDKKGNVLLYHLFGGLLSAPKYMGMDKEKMGASVKDQAKEALKAKLDKEKAKAMEKLNAEKAKAAAAVDAKKKAAQAKLDAEKAKLEAQKKAAEEKAKEEKRKAEEKAKEKAKEEAKKGLGSSIKKFGL